MPNAAKFYGADMKFTYKPGKIRTEKMLCFLQIGPKSGLILKTILGKLEEIHKEKD